MSEQALQTTDGGQQLAEVEDAANRENFPTFLGNQRMFRDKLFAFLPEMADRIIGFLREVPVDVMMANGTLVQRIQGQFALTDTQAAMIKMIMGKSLPNFAPVASESGQTPLQANNIRISITQIGADVDPHELPGQVVGISRAVAKQVAKITVKRPDEAQQINPPAIDAEYEEVPNDG